MKNDQFETRMPVGAAKSKSWIQTFTGLAFDPLNPDANLIRLEDVAHHLSNICRYTGAVKRFYSVAEHSVRVAWFMGARRVANMTKAQLEREGLFHDAGEAYLMDLANPVKVQDAFAAYRSAERKLDRACAERFALKAFNDEIVKREVKLADLTLLNAERMILLGPPPGEWGKLPDVPAWVNQAPADFGWTPDRAKRQFLQLAEVLGVK